MPPRSRNTRDGANVRFAAHQPKEHAMRKLLLLALPLVLAGCQTWGPTWSELTGARYYRAVEYRLPTIITRVDDQGAFASNPIKVEPGMHSIRVQGTLPGWGGYTYRTMDIEILPCKRYYLN